MTVTLHPIGSGSGIDYLQSTVAGDDVRAGVKTLTAYWEGGGDTPGEWLGQQAAELGISGRRVTQQAADALFKDALSPVDCATPLGRAWRQYPTADELYERYTAAEPQASEERLLALRAKADKEGNRTSRCGWEMVFSPVKSFSILWGCSGDEDRARLEAVEERAFRLVVERAERQACITRTGPTPASQVQIRGCGFIAAVYVHRSSRAGDPAYHRHLAISSKVRTTDGRWLALDARELHRIVVSLSEAYTAELERQMHMEFGIRAAARPDSIRPAKRPVREFLGVSPEAVKAFSQRRRSTERELAKMVRTFVEREGREPERAEMYKLAQAATLKVRPPKAATTIDGERRQWRKRAKALGLRRPDKWLRQAARDGRRRPAPAPDPLLVPHTVDAVLKVLENSRSSWGRANAEAEAYRQLVAAGAHLREDLHQMVDRVVEAVLSPVRCELLTPPEAVPAPALYRTDPDRTSIFEDFGARLWTSHAVLAAERALVAAAETPVPVRRLTAEEIDATLIAGEAARGFAPSAEQRQAVLRVFGADITMSSIIGPAGSGKTTIMRLVKEISDAHGIPVIGLAGGQIQADNLARESGIRCENLARWRTMSEKYGRGRPLWTLRRDAIVIVDESGQANTPDLAAVLAQVQDVDGRLLPIGDPRQLGAPGVGGALAVIEALVPQSVIYLTEVRRLRDPDGTIRTWEVEAARHLSLGEAAAAFDAYDLRGRLHAGGVEAVTEELYQAWAQDTADGLTSIMVASSNAQVARLCQRARDDRIAAGLVDDTRAIELADGSRVGVGDTISTRSNNNQLTTDDGRQWVRNGDTWTVEAVHRDGSLRARHRRTRRTVTLPPTYVQEAVELGYAITAARCQGVTVDVVRALLDASWTRNAAYPALTRGRYGNHAYLVTSAPPDDDTGEPGFERTARQVWHQIVERDGTELSATATAQHLEQRAQSVGTALGHLTYVLDELNAIAARAAIATVLDPAAAGRLAAAEAWPALRAQLAQLADEGLDTDRLLAAAWADGRGNEVDHRTGQPLRDIASIVVARIRDLAADKTRHQSYVLPQGAPRPATAPSYWAAPDARPGAGLLEAVGLVLPPADPGNERTVFAHALAAQAISRADTLAERARAHAEAGSGWAAAYGPRPEDAEEARLWEGQLAAAAAWRDLVDFAAARPTGDAPSPERTEQRGLWRAAQLLPDEQSRGAELAQAGPQWLDVLGPAPHPGDPRRAAWDHAAAAIATYRGLWDHGHESLPLGRTPNESVQATDHATATTAIEAYRRLPTTLVAAEERHDDARARAGAERTEQAAAALADVHRARRAVARSSQQAADDQARAQAAARRAGDAQQREHAQRLHQQALASAGRAATDTAALEEATTRLARLAPQALAAREAARRVAQQPRPEQPPTAPAPAEPGTPWQDRPFGELSHNELAASRLDAHGQAERLLTAADRAQEQADRVEARLRPGGWIDQRVRALTARVRGAKRLAAAEDQLAALAAEQQTLHHELVLLEQSLADTTVFGRPSLRGAERQAHLERQAAVRALLQELLDREHHHQAERAYALTDIGDPTTLQADLRRWEQAGASTEGYRGQLRASAQEELLHHRRLATAYTGQARKQRARAEQIRRELQLRAALPPHTQHQEDSDRQHGIQQREAQRRAERQAAALRRQQQRRRTPDQDQGPSQRL